MTAPTLGLPLRWFRVHVENVDVGPSEMICKECRAPMLHVGENGMSHEELFAAFPVANLNEIEPTTQTAVAASPWVCLKCQRGVIITR